MNTVACPHLTPAYTAVYRGVVFQLCEACFSKWSHKVLINCGHHNAHWVLLLGGHEWLLCDACHDVMLAQAQEREKDERVNLVNAV